MPKPSIKFRTANPIFEEGRVYARYLDQAAEGFFRFMLGRRSVDNIATAFTQPGHDLSYKNVTFAEREKVIVGMVSGYTAEQHRRSSDRPLKQAAGRFNLRMMVISTLFAPLFRIIDTIADNDFYIQAMAVDKELRGEGVGSTLMDFVEDHARANGSTRLSLDVSAGNQGARKLYEHRGMTVESQWPKRLAIPGVKFFRMVKAL
jgi:ribosomal protein S18 acetylase RimI-like enzyme